MSRPASVIVISRGRPDELCRTIESLRFQSHPQFEVIVVGGEPERAALDLAGYLGMIRMVAAPAPNVARARNAGLAQAAGEVLGYLDDDAIPGPDWLARLDAALTETGASAAAGAVRGPDGIGFQFHGALLREDGGHDPLPDPAGQRVLDAKAPGRVLAAMGTNLAFDAAALRAIGGFDPAFAYHLDESDVVWRLAEAGRQIVYEPTAQVVHGLQPSVYRSAQRVPRDLTRIGASSARFLAKHFRGDPGPALGRLRATQRRRLLTAMQAGRLMPDQVSPLLRTFDRGAETGRAQDPFPAEVGDLGPPEPAQLLSFQTLQTAPRVEVSRGGMRLRPRLTYGSGGVWWLRLPARQEWTGSILSGLLDRAQIAD